MSGKFDILVVGEVNPDLILSGFNTTIGFGQQETLAESAVLTIGSSSAIFACGAARLGLRVAFLGKIGDDLFGHFMLEELEKHSVNTSPIQVDSSLKTGLSVILNRGEDRAIVTYPGCMTILSANLITDQWLSLCRHLHVASYFLQTNLQPGLRDLFQRAHALGLTISLDTNWDPSGKWEQVAELLPLVDIFLPNENEAFALTQCLDVKTAAEQLSRLCKIVAVKMGNRGAYARQGEMVASVPAFPVEVVDTVGAGDTFDAGFVYGCLNEWSLEQSTQLAVACGSLSIRGSGGTESQPSLAEALQAIKLFA